jgi:hypothetical protein
MISFATGFILVVVVLLWLFWSDLKALWCAAFHAEHRRYMREGPIANVWSMECDRCHRTWVEVDKEQRYWE